MPTFRYRSTLLSLSLSILMLFLLAGFNSAYAGQIDHVVQPGDTLSKIASQHGTTVSQILRDNSIPNPNILRVGQVLHIITPDAPANPPAAQPTSPPATATPVPPADQGSGNPPPPSEPAPTATPIPQPAATATPVPSQGCAGYARSGETRYTVRAGDTLSGLASRYGTTVGRIKTRNCLNSDALFVGQLLVIPMGAVNPPQTPAPEATETRESQKATTPTATPTATPSSWLDRLLGR